MTSAGNAPLPFATRTIAVGLTIPDNAALTALATLERLGVSLGGLERADLYRVGLDRGFEEAAVETLREFEALFNPNKHRWSVRETASPEPGELWIAEREMAAQERVFGRAVRGVASFEPFVAWRLRDPSGAPADSTLVRRAAETLLCNLAFQRMED